MNPELEADYSDFLRFPEVPPPVCGRLRAIRPWNAIPRCRQIASWLERAIRRMSASWSRRPRADRRKSTDLRHSSCGGERLPRVSLQKARHAHMFSAMPRIAAGGEPCQNLGSPPEAVILNPDKLTLTLPIQSFEPPSTRMVSPVIQRAFSEAMNATTAPTSAGSAIRCKA